MTLFCVKLDQELSYEKAGWYNLCPPVKSINPESEGVRLRSVQSVTILKILNDTFYRYFSPVPNIFTADTDTFSVPIYADTNTFPVPIFSKQFQHSLSWEEQKKL